MMAASISAMALAAPELIVAPAQAFPSACSDAVTPGTPNNNNGVFNNGETVTCVSASVIPEIRSDADNVTIIIGHPSTPATVSSGGLGDFGVRLGDGGRVDIRNPMSSVDGREAGISLNTPIGSPHDLTLVSQGRISSFDGNGIIVDHEGDGSIFIDVDDVDGHLSGIRANVMYNTAGNVYINSSSSVRGQTGVGIQVISAGSGFVRIQTNDVYSGAGIANGIFASATNGTGMFITSTGLIAATNKGIRAVNNGNGNTSITVRDVIAADDGIDVQTATSTGSLLITANGNGLIDADAAGIEALHRGNGNLIINAQDITSVARGLSVSNFGTGQAQIDVRNVTSTSNGGIVVTDTGTGVSVRARGTVTAQNGAIQITNNGAGSATVNAVDVNSTTGRGIYVRNYFTATDVSVTATGTVDAELSGIFIDNDGTGNTVVDVYDVNSATERGIDVSNAASAGNLSITSDGAVTSQDGIGLRAVNLGSGYTSITTVDVSGGTSLDTGIFAQTGVPSTNLTITSTGTVSASGNGIIALNGGTGETSISVNNVTNSGIWPRSAIRAVNGTSATNLTIDADGTVYSYGFGIRADNQGTGLTTINVASVESYYGQGIGVVTGSGAGGLTITSTGTITAGGVDYDDYGVGILIDADGAGDVTIDADAAITGARYGVQIDKSGSGALDVQATSITGSVYDAVRIVNSAGTDVRVTTSGAVYGARSGIIIDNSGTGGTAVVAGDVTGASSHGIYVRNQNGAVSVTTTGTVIGGNDGIFARDFGAGGVTVNANDVTGDRVAIQAFVSGDSDVRVTATGTLSATTQDGVLALSNGNGDVDVEVADISAYRSGIVVANAVSGATNISITGDVTGQTGQGIYAITAAGAQVTIADGGSVSGAGTAILLDGPGNDILTLEPGSTVSGDIRLGGGDDTFNDGSGQFASFFGGDGTDTINFTGGEARVIDGSGNAGDRFQGVEIFNIDMDGIELTGEHTGLSEVNFNAGTTRLSGTLTSTQITVAEGAMLNAGDGSQINGFLDVRGMLAIGNSPGTTFVDGDVTFGPDSVLPIEIQGDANDLLVATGAVALDGALEIVVLGGVAPGTTTRTIIESGTGVTGFFSTISEQAAGGGQTGLLISNEVVIDDDLLGVSLTTTIRSPINVSGLNQNQTNVAVNLIDLLAQPSLDLELAQVINAVGALPDTAQLAAAVDELHPEGFDGGLRFLANSQNRFMSNLMSETGHVAVGEPKNKEGMYFWTSVGVSGLSQGSDYEHVGFDGDAYEFSAGVSEIGQGRVRLGFAGGYATFSGETEKGIADDIDASLYRFAASARLEMDGPGVNGELAGVASFAKATNKLTMNLIDPVNDASTSQSGKADVRTAGLAAQYTVTGINGKVWPVQPHVRIGLDAVSQDEVAVGTSQATALVVDKAESTRAHVALGASVERRIDAALSINASATAVQYFDDTQNVFQARFAAAPDGAPRFETVGASVERKAELQAGFVYEHESGFNLSADAFGEVGDVTAFTGRIELSRKF